MKWTLCSCSCRVMVQVVNRTNSWPYISKLTWNYNIIVKEAFTNCCCNLILRMNNSRSLHWDLCHQLCDDFSRAGLCVYLQINVQRQWWFPFQWIPWFTRRGCMFLETEENSLTDYEAHLCFSADFVFKLGPFSNIDTRVLSAGGAGLS